MACNVSVVHQAMASAIAQPNKAPPQPSCAHLSLSSNSKSKPFKLLRSSQYSFASTFSPSRPQTVVPFRSSRVPNFLYGLVHVADGDLLGAEIASGSENGRRAREYMEQGKLVPDEIVVMVPEDILVERVVGRRLDPITGKIYHLKHSPPETQEIASRLTQCFDDTKEKVKLRLNTHHQNVEAVLSLYEGITTKVKLRLNTHHQNVEAVLSLYEDITTKINGSVTKEDVFAEIDSVLTRLVEKRKATWESLAA